MGARGGSYAWPTMPAKQRVVLLVLAAAVVLVAVFVVPALTDSDDEGDGGVQTTVTQTATTPATGTNPTTVTEQPQRERPSARTIVVRGGKPRGGVQELSYRRGQTVDLVITSDTADEVHVHGYDVTKPIPAGGRARVRFAADAEGIFEIELHGSGQQIASLRVNPD